MTENKKIAYELLKIAKVLTASTDYVCKLNISKSNDAAIAHLDMSYSYANSSSILTGKDFKRMLNDEKEQPKTWQSILTKYLKKADSIKIFGYAVRFDVKKNAYNHSWLADVKWNFADEADFDKCKQELMDFLTKTYSFKVVE